jgi:hypothetical protein
MSETLPANVMLRTDEMPHSTGPTTDVRLTKAVKNAIRSNGMRLSAIRHHAKRTIPIVSGWNCCGSWKDLNCGHDYYFHGLRRNVLLRHHRDSRKNGRRRRLFHHLRRALRHRHRLARHAQRLHSKRRKSWR